MSHVTAKLDASAIQDWDSFHDSLQKAFGFPDFYGRNMNAWIDCMSDLDDPGAGMTTVHAPPGGVVVLQIDRAADLGRRCPELYLAILDRAAFVNWRRIEHGEPPVLALAFDTR